MNQLRDDLRYAFRNLRKHALLSAVVILTLSLGIGISSGVFTFIEADSLRARVSKDPDSFVRVYSAYTTDAAQPGRLGRSTLEDYLAFRDHAQSLNDVVAWHRVTAPLGQDDHSEMWVLLVTCDFFRLFELNRPQLGRSLNAEDCSKSNPVVMLSDTLWHSRFLADPQIVGKLVQFNGQPVTVVGVAPPGFDGQIESSQAWFPYTLQPYLQLGPNYMTSPDAPWLVVEGRLKPGYSRATAAAEISHLSSQQDRLHPGRRSTAMLTNGSMSQDPEWHETVGLLVGLTVGVLTFVVLIVCGNVIALLLSRADSRRHEMAVRLALGAGKGGLMRMLLTEALLLASFAGLGGLCLVYRFPRLLETWLVFDNPVREPLYPDWRVFTYLAFTTLVVAIMSGLAPAHESLRVNLIDSLKGRRTLLSESGRRLSLYNILIGAEIALTFFLLAAAGVFIRGHHEAIAAGPGYETRRVLIAQVFLRNNPDLLPHSWRTFHDTLTQALKAVPGVQSIAYASATPSYDPPGAMQVRFAGLPPRQAAVNYVSPGFFAVLGIPILSGRGLQETDSPCEKTSCRVVVSQRFANEFFPAANPLGKTMQTPDGYTLEIVGVARDTSSAFHGQADAPLIYSPWNSEASLYWPLVRFIGDGNAATRAVSATLRHNYPGASVKVETIQSRIDLILDAFWHLEVLVVILGVLATVLAIIGIYGVVAFAVSRRTNEIGIRIAMGAQKKHIYDAVLRSNVSPIAAGILAGALLVSAGGWVITRAFAYATFMPLRSSDPVVFATIPVVVITVTFMAMFVPARRATACDPVEALRQQ